MFINKIANYYKDRSRQRFIALLHDIATYDEYEQYDSEKTVEKMLPLTGSKRMQVCDDVYDEIDKARKERMAELTRVFKAQGKTLTVSRFNEMIKYIKAERPGVEPVIEEIHALPKEESERRKVIQQRAYNLFINKVCDQMACDEFHSLFSSVKVSERGIHALFAPTSFTKENAMRSIELMDLWKRVHSTTELINSNKERTKEQNDYVNGKYKEDRAELAKYYETVMTEYYNAAQELVYAKTDEEFLKCIEKNYHVCQVLAQSGLFDWEKNLNGLGISENDLSKEFVDYYKAHAELGVLVGAMNNRLAAMANPLYPLVDGEEIAKLDEYITIAPDSTSFSDKFNEKFAEPNMTLSERPNDEFNIFTGYSSNYTLYGETYAVDNVVATLSHFAYHYLGLEDYKKARFVDKEGVILDDIFKIKDMIKNGEKVGMLIQDNMSIVPIEMDKWGLPVVRPIEPSPFYDDLVDIHGKIQKYNEVLSDNLKIKIEGDDVIQKNEKGEEATFSQKLLDRLQKNYANPDKLRIHAKARELSRLRDGEYKKNGIKGAVHLEYVRLAKKYGKAKNEYMGRFFDRLLKMDGSEEARTYNEQIYKSYLAGTDEARLIYENAVKKMLNINLDEMAEAAKTIEGTVEFYEKHALELDAAYDIKNMAEDGKGFSREFTYFISKNNSFFQTFGMLSLNVNMAASSLYMADVYDQPALTSVDGSLELYELLNGTPEQNPFANATEFKVRQQDCQNIANDAKKFEGLNYITDVVNVNNVGREVERRSDGNANLKPRNSEDLERFDTFVIRSGKNYTQRDEFNVLLNAELWSKGINDNKYESMSEFIENNKGGWFNQKFGKDSGEYQRLVAQIKIFERKLQGDETAYDKNRADKTLSTEDYRTLKDYFTDYIKHKQQQLTANKTNKFDKGSTDDNRYKFALRMSDVLDSAIHFRPLRDLETTKETIIRGNAVNKNVDNEIFDINTNVKGGAKKVKNIVNEEDFDEDLLKLKGKKSLQFEDINTNVNKGKNIVNAESQQFNDGDIITFKQGELTDSILLDLQKTEVKSDKKETIDEKTPENEIKQGKGQQIE